MLFIKNERNLFIISRGYDKELYENIEKEEKPKLLFENKINIVYTGEIIENIRDIKPFIEAIKGK